MARYEAGETLASIARTYDCSPPAISYVVSRSRARHPGAAVQAKPPLPLEPQLIKAAGSVPATVAVNGHSAARENGFANGEKPPSAPQPGAAVVVRGRPPEVNGSGPGHSAEHHGAPAAGARPAPAAAQRPVPPHANGADQRRTLHLSLGNSAGANGNGHPPVQQPADRPNPAEPARGRDASPAAAALAEIRPAFDEPARRNETENPHRKEGGTFIDKELRARVDGDIAAFLTAFDAALLQDTQESRSALREATDRLLRAGARTRIELERLEARMPLPPRGPAETSEPVWRHR